MRKAALLLVPLFLLACDREPVAPDTIANFDAADAPPVTSGIVVRHDGHFLLSVADPDSDLWAFIGIDIYDVCDDFLYTRDVIPVHDLFLTGRRIQLAKSDDARTSVWRLSAIDGPDLPATCANIAATEPLAVGLSHVLYADNAVLTDVAPYANPYGWRFNGLLTGADGTKSAFSGHIFWTYDPDTGINTLRGLKVSLH